MNHSHTAIPLSIDLILSDDVPIVPATSLLERLKKLQAYVEIDVQVDQVRARSEILARRDELLAKGVPKWLLTDLPSQAERTFVVNIRWAEWPDNYVHGQISNVNPCLDYPSFGTAYHDFEFTKFAATELKDALGAWVRLKSTYGRSIETEFYAKTKTPIKWIQDYYATLDSSGASFDPITQSSIPFPIRHPGLKELDSWQDTIETAVVAFLEQLRKDNADDIAKDFSTYAAYAKRFVNELSEFGSINHCWSVELEESYHNEAIVEYSDWLALIRLSGVPRGLLK
ncbi:MAG: hypothetical protein ACK56W_15345 [Pirellula sp.]|jgi:hypothetical protein|nr:hypothetical protein [Pirellula sp.]